jgi:hypothetical protein
LDIPHKGYVDTAVEEHIPALIKSNGTQITAYSNRLDMQVEGTAVVDVRDDRVTSEVPVRYGASVQLSDPKDLTSKEYVD